MKSAIIFLCFILIHIGYCEEDKSSLTDGYVIVNKKEYSNNEDVKVILNLKKFNKNEIKFTCSVQVLYLGEWRESLFCIGATVPKPLPKVFKATHEKKEFLWVYRKQNFFYPLKQHSFRLKIVVEDNIYYSNTFLFT